MTQTRTTTVAMRMIRINPKNVNAYYERGIVFGMRLSDKKYEKAIADWEAVLKIDPKHPNAMKYIEMLRKNRGDNT